MMNQNGARYLSSPDFCFLLFVAPYLHGFSS